MMKFPLMTLCLYALLGPLLCSAQDLMTSTTTTMVVTPRASMNSAVKKKLGHVEAGYPLSDAVFLPPETVVRVHKRVEYESRQTVNKRTGYKQRTEYQVKREKEAVYVEVLNGQYRGSTGWMLAKNLTNAPSNFQAYQERKYEAAVQAQARQAALDQSVDLVVTVSSADSYVQFAGKKVHAVRVTNLGGLPLDGTCEVLVELDGNVLKKERIRQLRPGGSHYFNVEVSESVYRRGGRLVVKADPDNAVQEFSEENNTANLSFSGR